jgi:hypothetical protein
LLRPGLGSNTRVIGSWFSKLRKTRSVSSVQSLLTTISRHSTPGAILQQNFKSFYKHCRTIPGANRNRYSY